jgi:hypothetical protein
MFAEAPNFGEPHAENSLFILSKNRVNSVRRLLARKDAN